MTIFLVTYMIAALLNSYLFKQELRLLRRKGKEITVEKCAEAAFFVFIPGVNVIFAVLAGFFFLSDSWADLKGRPVSSFRRKS